MSWTDERVATLKKLWGAGKSASEIAIELGGVTRNAVIGKAHRLGLSGRPSPIKKETRAKKPAPAKAPAGKKKPAAAQPAPAKEAKTPVREAPPAPQRSNKPVPPTKPVNRGKPPATRLSILDLTERMCRWPYGDPKLDDFTFCGKPVHPGTPYCGPHCLEAYQSSRRD